MNRMTSDIGMVDGPIGSQFQFTAWLVIAWVASVVIIASVTPIFLVFSLVITATFVIIFRRFLPTSQSLRRLEVNGFDFQAQNIANANDNFSDDIIESADVKLWNTVRFIPLS